MKTPDDHTPRHRRKAGDSCPEPLDPARSGLHGTRPKLGSAYPDVWELRRDLHVGLRPDVVSVRQGSDQVNFDLEGRFHRAWLDGEAYQRGLDGRLRRVKLERESAEERWFEVDQLRGSDKTDVLTRANQMLREALRSLGEEKTAPAAGAPTQAAREQLERASHWTRERYDAEDERYAAVYSPLRFLPPDQQLALVLEATGGCNRDSCPFCGAARPEPARTAAEFQEHVRAAKDLVGRALVMRRGALLLGAQVPHLDAERLAEVAAAIQEELGPADRWPLAVFTDIFEPALTSEAWRTLRQTGVKSVTLGIPSGSTEALRAEGFDEEDAAGAILAARRFREGAKEGRGAPMRLGVAVFLGLGADAEHERATVEMLAQMELERGDRIYLSPPRDFVTRDMSLAELSEQAARLRLALRESGATAAIADTNLFKFMH